MKKISLLLLVAIACFNIQSYAQTQKIVADKIIAQVGDKIILSNEYDEYKNRDLERGPLPECFWLERQIIEKSLILLAAKDSLLSEDELNTQLDNQIKFYISEYGSKKELEDAAHKSIYQIKEDIRAGLTERMLAEKMRNKITNNMQVTPAEVRNFFGKIPPDSLPFVEETLEIKQLVVYPKPNKEVDQYLVDQLLDWKRQVEKGEQKFDAIARLHNQDPGSREQGGLYAVNRNDRQWDSAWSAAIWKLKTGQVSPVIKSGFGLHIIQLVSRVGDDAIIRHILLIPPVSQPEINATQRWMDTIRAKIVAGNLGFGEAVAMYSEDVTTKATGGALLSSPTGAYQVTRDELDKAMETAVKGMGVGDISQPQWYKDNRGRDAVRIILLKATTNGHVENIADDYEQIAKQALEAKKQQALQQFVASHITGYYVAIDQSFADCDNLAPWLAPVK